METAGREVLAEDGAVGKGRTGDGVGDGVGWGQWGMDRGNGVRVTVWVGGTEWMGWGGSRVMG